VVNTTSGYFLFSELGLVFGDDFEGDINDSTWLRVTDTYVPLGLSNPVG
jgi:hypothetical protein